MGTRGNAALAAALMALGTGCFAPQESAEPLREQYVLSRLTLDPITTIGHLLAEDTTGLASEFDIVFEIANCDGASPIVADLDATRIGTRAVGRLHVYVAAAQSEDPCGGAGEFAVDDRSPTVSGPLYMDGTTAEAHIPLARINEDLLGFLPVWWSIRARRREGAPELDAEARAPWTLAALASSPSRTREGRSLLDELATRGAQPDLDVDRDGLERLEDTDGDGRVDRCVQPAADPSEPPIRVDGPECVHDPRFADAYELVLRFRMIAGTLSTIP